MHSKAIFNRFIRPLTMAIRRNYLACFNLHLMKNNLAFSKRANERVDLQVSLFNEKHSLSM